LKFEEKCTLEFVGAAISRPRSKMLRIRRNLGEKIPLYRRAINDRPYINAIALRDEFQFEVPIKFITTAILCSFTLLHRFFL